MGRWPGSGYCGLMDIIGADSRRLQGPLLVSRRVLLVAVLGAAVLPAMALTGCSSGDNAPVRNGSADTVEGSVSAADDSWAAKLSPSDKLLYVTTYGSSTCPSFLTSVKLSDGDHLDVTAEVENPSAMCTADLAPWTSSIAVPDSVFAHPTVRVTLAGHAEEISLPTGK